MTTIKIVDSRLTPEESVQVAELLNPYFDDLRTVRYRPWCEHEWPLLNLDNNSKDLLKTCSNIAFEEPNVDISTIISNSNQFPIPFPIQTIRLETLKRHRPIQRLQKNINSTYPIAHERVLLLIARFLTYKRKYGSQIEKELYENMSVSQFIERILKKRAVVFYGAYDKYKLLNGKPGRDGWEKIGTSNEEPRLSLKNCLSYDELKISSMIYVSGYTECINDGARNNVGVVKEEDIEPHAVIIGIIGPRFQRAFKMEYEDIIIDPQQNTSENGYGDGEGSDEAKRMWRKLWEEFYQVPSHIYEELKPLLEKSVKNKLKKQTVANSRLFNKMFVETKKGTIFSNEVYYKRLRVTTECVLLEAEARAKAENKFAFLNVIGIGLGKWKVSPHQDDVFVAMFLERIVTFLQNDQLNHISDINFAFFKPLINVMCLFDTERKRSAMGQKIHKLFYKHRNHPKGGINVQLENREPLSKLAVEHEGKLLVTTYAWDSNAHPGNEFWLGKLDTSGDPAAACSTQVAELHNAHINPTVCGDNARIVDPSNSAGVITLSAYSTSFNK